MRGTDVGGLTTYVTDVCGRAGRTPWGRRPLEPGPLAQAADAWAHRVHAVLPEDPLVLLHAMLPDMLADQLARIASEALGREVTGEDVLEARMFVGVQRRVSGRDSFPPVLSAHLVRLAAQQDPAAMGVLRRELVRVLSDSPRVEARHRIEGLLGLAAWAALNRALARDLPWVALLTSDERVVLLELMLPEVPSTWMHLFECRGFLTQARSVPRLYPIPWGELLQLLNAADSRYYTPVVAQMRDRLVMGMSYAHSTNRPARDTALLDAMEWFLREVEHLHATASRSFTLPTRVLDDARLMAYALLGMADAAMATGYSTTAHQALKAAESLQQVVGGAAEESLALHLGLLSRQAFVYAYAGERHQAEQLMGEYEQAAEGWGVRESQPEHVMSVARRYLATMAYNPVRVNDTIVPNTSYTPLEVHAESVLVLIDRGPVAAADWVQTYLARIPWTDLNPLDWWPLHAMRAYLALRAGDATTAQEVAASGVLPPLNARLVEAGLVALAGDRPSLEDCVRDVTLDEASPERWRRLAHAYRISLLTQTGAPEAQAEAEAHTEALSATPVVVALLSDAGRAALIPGLDPLLSARRGIVVDDGAASRTVALTPRQRDLLGYLASDMTLAQIADELFLGVETIRSTSKALYKRLGVHNREDALTAARTAGLL